MKKVNDNRNKKTSGQVKQDINSTQSKNNSFNSRLLKLAADIDKQKDSEIFISENLIKKQGIS